MQKVKKKSNSLWNILFEVKQISTHLTLLKKKKKKNQQQNNPECKSGKTKKQYPTNITNALMEQASHGVNIQKKRKKRKKHHLRLNKGSLYQ